MKLCNDKETAAKSVFATDAHLLSVSDVQKMTGLNYRRALLLVKNMKFIRIGQAYFVSTRTFLNFLNQKEAIEIDSDL